MVCILHLAGSDQGAELTSTSATQLVEADIVSVSPAVEWRNTHST